MLQRCEPRVDLVRVEMLMVREVRLLRPGRRLKFHRDAVAHGESRRGPPGGWHGRRARRVWLTWWRRQRLGW